MGVTNKFWWGVVTRLVRSRRQYEYWTNLEIQRLHYLNARYLMLIARLVEKVDTQAQRNSLLREMCSDQLISDIDNFLEGGDSV